MHVMQTLDVKAHTNPIQLDSLHETNRADSELLHAKNKTTGAEPAVNGNSFLAILKKMIDGNKEGLQELGLPVRGAGELLEDKKDSALIGCKKNNKLQKHRTLKQKNETTKNACVFVEGLKDVVLEGQQEKEEKEHNKIGLERHKKAIKNKKDSPNHIKQKMLDELEKQEKHLTKNNEKNQHIAGSLLKQTINTKPKPKEQKNQVEKQDPNRFENIEKPQKKIVFQVRDERKNKAVDISKSQHFEKRVSINDDNTAEMKFTFKESTQTFTNIPSSRFQFQNELAKKEQSFASMLSQELKNNASDFVKAGQIILRDNNSGVIRLSLHPESLGNVRISLELFGNNKISGKIQVSSQEAWDAFNENLGNISDAFTEGGFETAGFNLSWSGSNASNQGSHAQANLKAPFYASSVQEVMSSNNFADTLSSKTTVIGNAVINLFA